MIPAGALEPVLAFDAAPGAGCAFWAAFAEFEPDVVVVLLVEGGVEFEPDVVVVLLDKGGAEGPALWGVTAGAWLAGCDGGFVVGGVGAIVVASSKASNGWPSLCCAWLGACCHCDDATVSVAPTSDTILGTAEPLPSR